MIKIPSILKGIAYAFLVFPAVVPAQQVPVRPPDVMNAGGYFARTSYFDHIGYKGMEFDTSRMDPRYEAQMLKWQTAGVQGGIPRLEELVSPENVLAELEPTDSAGLNAAISAHAAAAQNMGGGTILLRNGTYTIDATVNMQNHVRLVGESREGVVLLITIETDIGSSAAAIRFNNNIHNAGLVNLTLRGSHGTPDPYNLENLKPEFYVTSVNFNYAVNCWLDGVNIIDSGNHPINAWRASHITIRDCYVDGAWNKGGGGSGYVQIMADHFLITRNHMRQLRHFAIQKVHAEHNVVIGNYLEQDINFHDSDSGNTLVEANRIVLPTTLRPGWHPLMGPWSVIHYVSHNDNFVFNNRCIELNNDGLISFSDPNVVYLGARNHENRPNPTFATTTEVPLHGTFYPVVIPQIPPVSTGNTYSMNAGETLNADAPGVLANDFDANDDVLTAQLQSDVSHGSLTLHPDGSFHYTPNAGFAGEDSFTYAAHDGTDTGNTVTVTIRVNTPPVVNAGADQSAAMIQGLGPWTPAEIPTAAWYDAGDASTLTASGGAVSQWADKSGNGNHATQATDTKRPTTGLNTIGGVNVINFQKANLEHLKAPDSPSLRANSGGGYGLYAVYNKGAHVTVGSGINALLGKGPVQNDAHEYGIYNNVKLTQDGHVSLGIPNDTNALVSAVFDDATSTTSAWRDGNSRGSKTGLAYVDSTHPFVLGGDVTESPTWNRYSNCNIGEVLIVSGIQSVELRQKIEGYLAHKWGLADTLPGDHPYRVSVPDTSEVAVTLSATATDADGDPLTNTWSKLSGPGNVVFADASALETTATFFIPGTYVLRLTSDDGISQTMDDVTITISEPVTPEYAAWLEEHYGTTAVDDSVPSANGVNTIREAYIAGLDPTDPASTFRLVTATPVSGGAVAFESQTAPGKHYRVYYRDSLVTGDWLILPGYEDRNGDDNPLRIEDNPAGTRFYMIAVRAEAW
ncbi:MAG: cadherin-like domain-containing protein [Verrucomicrobia bacterium]|nr:cadherin-like domain-containing protein [Verrucomicrobiota bacterium]MCH8528659.1 cadherin-like domain-containing protein [Kiritimatiellia bacterium]